MEQKLVVCIMGENCERFIDMCLKSVKDADAIVYCDGGSTDNTKNIWTNFLLKNPMNSDLIYQEYDQNDKGMNGKQRNFYLNYLKENYKGWYALCLDADEIVDENGIKNIKEFIKDWDNRNSTVIGEDSIIRVWDVHMRHLISDLAHEDNTVPIHRVPRRLFKIEDDLFYHEVEHPILRGNFTKIGACDATTIWHLAYCGFMWDIKKRYDNHMQKSNMHTPEFLKQWYHWHLFGSYPKKEFNPVELPGIVLNEFGINKDELYFANRGIDMKHPIMVQQWNQYFKPHNILDLGCGRGPYLYFWNWFVENSNGVELSNWAVKNSFVADRIYEGDISKETTWSVIGPDWDLITAIDVLEHLDDNQLNDTLTLMSNNGQRFLFSIPFDKDEELNILADPNLALDKTHKQFRSKREWIKLIESHNIKIIEPPNNWLFKDQLLIGIRNI